MTPAALRELYQRSVSARNQGDTEAFCLESDILAAIPAIAAAWERAEADREALLTACKLCLPYIKNWPWDTALKIKTAIAKAEEPRA